MKTSYRDAMRAAIREALQRDERVFLMGEDVGRYGGCYAVSLGLLEEFGPERIRDTPLSESAFTGAGIGATMRNPGMCVYQPSRLCECWAASCRPAPVAIRMTTGTLN